jgi:FimV-like protein
MHRQDLPLSHGMTRARARLHAVGAAVLLCWSLAQHGNAQAVVLGRIEVQSRIGEPLRAEIELADITAQDAAQLQVSLSRAGADRTPGLQTNPAELQISLQRSESGRIFLLLSTRDALTEPFLDLVLEAQWSSGRSLREYTLVLQPGPISADASPAEPAPAAPSVPQVQAPTDPTPATGGDSAALPIRQQVPVKTGDTAGQIAARYRPAGVSLDQMLVALQRANPQAFVGGNVNRLKAGVVMELPALSEAQGTAPEQARQVIAAQSRDFNEFRRRLTAAAKPAQAAEHARQSSGPVQAEVKEERGPAPLVDKLVLSKGPVNPGSAEEEAIAQQAQARDNASQLQTLSRNIEALDQLKAQVPASLADAPPATARTASPSQGGVALATEAAALPRALSARIESLIQQPWILPVTAGLLALLAGLGMVVSRRSQKNRRLNQALLDEAPPLYRLAERPGSNTAGGGKDRQVDGLRATHGADSSVLDLDLDLDLEPKPHGPPTPPVKTLPAPVDFDFDFPPEMAAQIHASTRSGPRPLPQPDELGEDFELDDNPEPLGNLSRPSGPDLSQRFDWASLQLEIDAPPSDGLRFDGLSRAPDPLQAQLDLAEALLSEGDVAAARAAAEAVHADASGLLKTKAERFLALLR